MDKTAVIWQSYHKPEIISRGYWDNGLIEDIFERGNFEHYDGFEDFISKPVNDERGDGAIVVINGRTHTEDIEAINADLERLRWVVLMITGDEEAIFPWGEIRHPLLRTWVMLPRMNQHNDVSFKIPNGFRPATRVALAHNGYHPDHSQDWFFCGQVTHERREQLAQELQYLLDSGANNNGKMVKTDHFGAETMPYHLYIANVANTKIMPAPSGPESPDSFRLYEALEAGCLPIVDAFSTNNKTPGFWQFLFGNDIPFPVVDYWDKLIPLLPELIKGYPQNANKAYAWWQLFKRNMYYKLIDDITEVSK
jgi:hypothetical protein